MVHPKIGCSDAPPTRDVEPSCGPVGERLRDPRMPELILHQYAMSPFSEKIRKVLAAKQLAWRAVDQPMWNPKPQLVPLTGGYRRIPVLQIGADVYCDTACILHEL